MNEPRVQHTEEIARKWFPGTNDIKVQVVRSATLDEELRQVSARRLDSIDVTWGHGERRTMGLDIAAIEWLRDALDLALEATDDFAAPTTPVNQGAQS